MTVIDERPSIAPPIRPLGIGGSLLMFGIPALGFAFAELVALPALVRRGLSAYAVFVVTFLGPLAALFAAALITYRLEGRPWAWAPFAERLRLHRMTARQWVWTLGLVIGSFALQAALVPVSRALGDIPLVRWPAEFAQFMSSMERGNLGVELRGRWDILAVVALGLGLFNVVGEELWWRGIILPRQELAFGRWTWIWHGVLWDLFHSFYYTDVGKAISYLGITMPVAYVAQRTKSTWPGFVLHYIINIGFPFIVAKGVLGF